MSPRWRIAWTEEMDATLLRLVKQGKRANTIESALGISKETIRKRLKQMGFANLIDARRVLSGNRKSEQS